MDDLRECSHVGTEASAMVAAAAAGSHELYRSDSQAPSRMRGARPPCRAGGCRRSGADSQRGGRPTPLIVDQRGAVILHADQDLELAGG